MISTPASKTQQWQVHGMDCGNCAKTIEASLQQISGMTEISVSFATGRVKVSYNPQHVSEAEIKNRITALGYTIEQSPTRSLQAQIGGMDCGSCAKTVEAALQQVSGVSEISVSFATGRLNLTYDPQQVSETALHDRIKALGYTIQQNSPEESSHSDCCSDHEHDFAPVVSRNVEQIEPTGWKVWIRDSFGSLRSNRRSQSVLLAGVGLILGLIAQQLALPIWMARAFYGVGIIVAGYPIARAGLFELRLRRADMNLLMTISVIGAVILGDWFEGALVVLLFSLGTTLQSFSFGRTRNAIRALMDLTPRTATVKRNGKEVTVPAESVQLGEILTIRPGQRIALDGVVVAGDSAVDQSPITGESVPEDKSSGDSVFAGTLNQTGFLEVKVTHTSEDTTVAKIIHLVETAQSSRAPSQQWIDRFAEIYTPLVILIAVVIAVIPPLVFTQPFDVWLYRALTMLVIACPCALVISTPVSIVSAIGAATRQGVLFKGGDALETAGKLNILAFDKTGTITRGLPSVQNIYALEDVSVNQVLLIAASLEQQSEHPLAKAIVTQATDRTLELVNPENFKAFPGKGIQAAFGSLIYIVGNRRLFADQKLSLPPKADLVLSQIEGIGQTPVLVGTTQNLLGVIALADGLRLEAPEAMRSLQKAGVKKLVMLTGDRAPVAQQIAHQVHLSDYRAELLPEDKLEAIQQLRRSGIVGMVGDGINDAPALAAADISFAVGGIDITLETADVVLVGSDLRKLAYAVNLSRRTVSVIQQNVTFSLVTKALFFSTGYLWLCGASNRGSRRYRHFPDRHGKWNAVI